MIKKVKNTQHPNGITKKMAAENASNGPVSNGNIPTPEKPTISSPGNLFTTIVLTIYDVIVFLAVSIGYIFQVSMTVDT